MSSESAEPGWLRLGDLAIGNGGVCVTSLIKDKIREYMLNEEHQTGAGATKAVPSAASKAGGDTCVRRIGNSLDLLLRESRNAGHAVAAVKNKSAAAVVAAAAAAAAADDHCAVSTTVCAPADSSRPVVLVVVDDGPTAKSKRYSIIEDEMQISRMPIPADDCANSEMSVDTNPSDSKSDLENTTKVNGSSNHTKLNGSTTEESTEADETSKLVIKEESESSAEVLLKTTEEPIKNGSPEETNSEEIIEENNKKENDNEKTSTDNVVPEDNKVLDEEVKPMEVDQTEDQPVENVVIKEELEEVVEPEVTEETETQESEKLNNGDAAHCEETVEVKESVNSTISVNGEGKLSDEEKSIKVEGVKVPEEEDMSSEISTDALSPKQIEEPIARKRSAASHDELSVVSGGSSDNDLPKIKKLRSEEEVPLLKDDTRERLIKNIVQSSGKNETELSKNIEKIQNEIKVITEIAQTKRDELVTLIRLQKLKEEIIERLMIKVKEFDAAKTDNSKDWNLPEMFQINLSQPEHILSEKNITDIIDNRETQLEKSSASSYDQNNFTTLSSSTIITSSASTSNIQSNDWMLSDRVNRINRVQRPILPKPISANNQKEGRQGPVLDVKLIIADHRLKNPETAVPKRGRRKAAATDFSVPTSSAPLRYPNPMGFANSLHIVNDGNFKTSVTNTHAVSNNIMEHGSEHNRFKDVPAFPEVTLHPVSQPIQQQQQQPTSLLHGILTKGTHHLPLSMANPPTNYSPTLARLLTAPERCKQTRGKRQSPAATVVSSNSQSRNEITITPVQSTSMSSTFQHKPIATSNIPPSQVDDEDASDRLVIDEGQDSMNASSPSSAPQCQGCMQKPAQFVCAGCGNQWYCSKDCQIDAWDDHSEVCSG